MARDRIHIHDLEVRCVIGVNPGERHQEQPLSVDLDLDLDLARAGYSGQIADTCNYDRVADEVIALLRFRRYRLLEVAAEELAAMLFGVHPALEGVRITLTKPRALLGRARAAGVTVGRRPADFPRRHEDARFGTVEVVMESAEAGLYLLHVGPGRTISRHVHRKMHELEWRVCGDLLRNGAPLVGLGARVWEKDEPHEYRNVGTREATLFCCDSPRFIPDDEILQDPTEVDPRRAEVGLA
ncbi:MAG TPA: dihydroneopterin aldolase [Nannocystaceae bacterium]|nr:dihydroneopterin aldolase [Nannocystaceae bacterium]